MAARIAIRAARPRDVGDMGRVHVETWRDSYAGILPDSYLVNLKANGEAMSWLRTLGSNDSRSGVLVAEAKEGVRRRLVGFGSCGPSRAGGTAGFAGGACGEIYTLYVAPGWQGFGIGAALLEQLFAGLSQAGQKRAYLWVLRENPARFFYQALGGRRLAERTERFAGVELPEIAYGWDDLPALVAQGLKSAGKGAAPGL